MKDTKEILKSRENQLLQWKTTTQKALEVALPGTLRFCKHGAKTQYYHRTNPKDTSGIYIPQKNLSLARNLAQKDYDKKLLCSIEKELNAIQKYLSTYPELNAENIYDSLHEERKKLVTPLFESDEDFLQKWKAVEYEGKGFKDDSPEFYTANGERVRSKSELIIADLLSKEGIPYRYEYPIYLKGYGRIYPDFTTLNVKTRKEILWEHLGMMDDSAYVEKALQRISLYEQNGYFPGENLILTYETQKTPLSSKIIRLMIKKYLT